MERNKFRKWRERDSNSGPTELESDALTTRPRCPDQRMPLTSQVRACLIAHSVLFCTENLSASDSRETSNAIQMIQIYSGAFVVEFSISWRSSVRANAPFDWPKVSGVWNSHGEYFASFIILPTNDTYAMESQRPDKALRRTLFHRKILLHNIY